MQSYIFYWRYGRLPSGNVAQCPSAGQVLRSRLPENDQILLACRRKRTERALPGQCAQRFQRFASRTEQGGHGGKVVHRQNLSRVPLPNKRRRGPFSVCPYPIFFSRGVSLRAELHVVFRRQAPHVQYGVAHPPERRIDAHALHFGYLPESQVLVEAHLDDFPLALR